MRKLYVLFILFFVSLNIYSQNKSEDLQLTRWIILSNNIVEGTIIKINDSNFLLKINKNLKGNTNSDTILISKEVICKKYADYQLNTKAMWILFKSRGQYHLKGRGKSIFYDSSNGFLYSPIFGKCSIKNFTDVVQKSSEYFTKDIISNKIIKKVDDNILNDFAKKSSFHKYFIENAKKIIELDNLQKNK